MDAGETAVIDVAELTTYEAAGTVPNFTALGPPRLVPVRVTDVPPATTPLLGEIALTAGPAAQV